MIPLAAPLAGTSSGNYVYLEASNGCFEQEAILLSPCFDLSSGASTPEFSFWYHMLGDNMGELHVDALGDDLIWDMDVIPVVAGDQGNMWRTSTVDLTSYMGGKVVLRIRGITGDEYSSDMALDDLGYEKSGIGVTANTQGWGIQLYPNPAISRATLQLSQVQGSSFTVEVLNALMQPVQTSEGLLQGGQGQLQLDLRSLSAGIYFVRVMANDQVIVRKLEVTH
jgi:hypothetical protein